MIWYDMIWYDMIWYDMIWYDMIWYDMIWYDMIWYDMIWYDICIFFVPAGTLRLRWLRFLHAFSSVVRQMPGYNLQRRGTARTLSKCLCCSIYCVFCIVLHSYIVCVWMCTVLYYCHRVSTRWQLTNISYIYRADHLSRGIYMYVYTWIIGARGGAVGWGTAL